MRATRPGRPIVIAHRGACGYLPEHTLAAYALAIRQGADFIEPDLVATRDGVLVARHDNDLSSTTDVAARGEFADRRCRKCVDGVEVEGWFSEDFSLDEIRRLRARERLPGLRPASAREDGLHAIPTFADILALAQGAGRPVGVYPEIKHPTWFAQEGRHLDGAPVRLSLGALLVDALLAAGFTDPARLYVQSFEPASLRELREVLLPRAGLALPLVQLLGPLDRTAPWDIAWHRARGHAPTAIYGDDVPWSDEGPPVCYAELVQPRGLAWLRRHADALGPHKDDLLRPDGVPAWFGQALALGFAVHPYTLRREFNGEAEARRLLELGVQGWFIDQPDLGVAVRDAWLDARAG